jgi:hypothetical protein
MTNEKNIESVNDHLKSKTNLVKVNADLEKVTHRWCEIEHGPTEDGDYVWHFQDFHPQRMFPENQKTITEIIFTFLDKFMPQDKDFVVDHFPSPEGWDRSVITIIARDVGKFRNFDEDRINTQLEKIGNMISDEVEKHTTRRKFL